jgi:hypothetical protein
MLNMDLNQSSSLLFFDKKENFRYTLSKFWLFTAILSISLSGFFAFFITIARTPEIYKLFSDPSFFKKALAIHVNLGFLIWLSCYLVSIFYLTSINNNKKFLPYVVSLSGIILLSIPSLFLGGKAILSNYVPVIDNPAFFVGIFLFSLGVFLALIDKNLFLEVEEQSFIPYNSIAWIKSSAILFIIAFETGILTYILTSQAIDIQNYFEILFWAPGHIFVFSIEALKISLWFAILNLIFPEVEFFRKSKTVKITSILFLILPLLSLLIFRYETHSQEFRNFYTQLMRWGIFPFVLFIIYMIFYNLFKDKIVYNINIKNNLKKYLLWSIYLSIFMTILGYLLGSLIRIPNTMVPGHYHASIGAITLILMSFSIILFDYFELHIKNLIERYKIFSLQPLIYAIGQSIFAIGFAIAGIKGQGRKLFAKDQEIRGVLDYLGLGFVGIGGLIAIFAGILFVILSFYCLKHLLSQILSEKSPVLIFNNKNTKSKEVHYGEQTSNSTVHG